MAEYLSYVKLFGGSLLNTLIEDPLLEADLTDGENYYLSSNGYSPKVARLRKDIIGSVSSYEDVTEEINFYIQSNTRMEAMRRLGVVASILDRARLWGLGERVSPVYIEVLFGRQPYRSMIVDADSTPLMSLSATFHEQLKAYTIGPIRIQITRRGQWSRTRVEVASSTPRSTLSDIEVATLTFATGYAGHGAVDLEIDGFASITDVSPTGTYAFTEEGYLLVSREGGIDALEGEFLVAADKSDNFEDIESTSGAIYSGGHYARMIYTPYLGGWAIARLHSEFVDLPMRYNERLGVFAMLACDDPTAIYEVRGYGLSNGHKVNTSWQTINFETEDTPDEDPETPTFVQHRVRPTFIGVLSSLGGFDSWGIEVRFSGEDEPIASDRLRVDYVAIVDMDSIYSRVLWVDARGVRFYPSEEVDAITFKLVFNTGAVTLKEPQVYLEQTPNTEDPAKLGTIRGEMTILRSSGVEDQDILAYKYPLGNVFLEATSSLDVLWFGRGSDSWLPNAVPVKGDKTSPAPIDIVYRAFRRQSRLVPE